MYRGAIPALRYFDQDAIVASSRHRLQSLLCGAHRGISTMPQRQQTHKSPRHNCSVIHGFGAAAIRYFDQDAMVGLILGTGSNACYVERIDQISALPQGQHGPEMIVNVEWGNFDGDSLPKTQFDRDIDDITPNAGEQAFEKQISGELADHSHRCCCSYCRCETARLGAGACWIQQKKPG